MSQPRCPYCGSTDGCITTTSPVSLSPLFVKECKSCNRIVEEYRCNLQDMFVERAEDTPFCIVTPDFSNNEEYRTPPIEDDPFENIGFITAFSTWSMELAPLYTSTTSSFCGYLAELERILLNPVSNTSTTAASTASSSSTVDTLRAYFQILEVSSLLGLDRDISDHAFQLFRDCCSAACMRNRNVEALATAALVQASREAKEARTLQEISTAANVSQKEIHRYMKILTDALKLSQPIDSNSISVYMPRFCSILELDKSTQDLATHIGEVVMNKSFCTRRNPISISAAAIYLACQLEDKRKTQTEICKATALTEVTLRKVYKELLENIDDLLPPNYTPVVPLERAFPVSSTRAPTSRAAGLGTSLRPLSAISSLKPNGGVDSTNFPHCNSLGNEVNTACSREASVVEHFGLFDLSNTTSKSCIEKSMVVSNDKTSRLVAVASNAASVEASASMGKNILSHRTDLEWNRSSEPLNEASAPNTSGMHHQFKCFRPLFQDAFHSSAVAGASKSPNGAQTAASVSSNSAFNLRRLHPSLVPMREVSSTTNVQCEDFADKEVTKDIVYNQLGIEHGKLQEEVDDRGPPNCLNFECSIKDLATASRSLSSLSQGLNKGLWDLNIAESVSPEHGGATLHPKKLDVSGSQECGLSSDLQTQSEIGGNDLLLEKPGISGSGPAKHVVTAINLPFFCASNSNSEHLSSTAAIQGVKCDTEQKALHASFWQPLLHVSSSPANSMSMSGDMTCDMRSGIPSNFTAETDQLHSVIYPPGKINLEG